MIISDPAPFAEDISGTNEKTLPAWMELNVVHYKRDELSSQIIYMSELTIRPAKKWKVEASKCDTKTEPYQNTRAMTKKTIPCDMPNNALLQRAVRFDLFSGSSRLSLYNRQQSSSLVKEATVRIAPAASQAI